MPAVQPPNYIDIMTSVNVIHQNGVNAPVIVIYYCAIVLISPVKNNYVVVDVAS